MVPMDYVPPAVEYDPLDASPVAQIIRRKEANARTHPYWYETKHLGYPTSMFITAPPIQQDTTENTPFTYVDTPEQLKEMVETLKTAKEIAVDLEHHNMRSYDGFTCLMQISIRGEDWVVDTLKLRGELREGKLGGVLADPAIIKVTTYRNNTDLQVFHGADSDILWLQQDFGIYVVNLFDTYHATKVLGTCSSLSCLGGTLIMQISHPSPLPVFYSFTAMSQRTSYIRRQTGAFVRFPRLCSNTLATILTIYSTSTTISAMLFSLNRPVSHHRSLTRMPRLCRKRIPL
jgi:hypothetical protein